MFGYLEDEEIEIRCPNDGCYNTIRVRYSEAFNTGQFECYSCGAKIQLDPSRMGYLRDAVSAAQRTKDELERAEQKLKDATDRLLEGAQLTKKL